MNSTEQASQVTITLNEEERTQLLAWLEERLQSKLVEEHRTDALDYKTHLIKQEALLEQLISKLRLRGL